MASLLFRRPEAASLEATASQAKEDGESFAFSCTALGYAKTVCLFVKLAPVFGTFFGVCQEVLEDVQKYHGNAREALEGAGRFITHAVEYIELLAQLFEERLRSASSALEDVARLEERIVGLNTAVREYQESVAKFSTVTFGFGLQGIVDGVEKAKKRLIDEEKHVARLCTLMVDDNTLGMLLHITILLEQQMHGVVAPATHVPVYNSDTNEALAIALCAAARVGDVDKVEEALRAGANPNLLVQPPPEYAVDKKVRATYPACKKESAEILRLLVERGGANANLPPDANRRSLLEYVVLRNNVPCLAYLVTVEGIDLETTDSQGYTPLITAAREDKRHEILQLLVEAGANLIAKNGIVDDTSKDGYTALGEAQRKGANRNAAFLARVYRSKIEKTLSTDDRSS
eukprot:CAMPEP_0197395146 /NCGR_PEP_ID=MMETSP1165-20131217/6353_1 /TAXON_ID=284809 /ORGANISM="Chrysocystis fragilis, Strain CCMP3189" /LENGTH=402 /DNA_ID=CAMNT_0042920897 /DNA_START=27 /DNA_END=1235 /DNA_ORIENTATION=-